LLVEGDGGGLDEASGFGDGAEEEDGDACEDGGGDDDGVEAVVCPGVEAAGEEGGDEEGPDVAEAEDGLEGGAAVGRAEFGGEGEVANAVDEKAKAEDEVRDGEGGEGLGGGDPEAEDEAEGAGGEEEHFAAAAVAYPAGEDATEDGADVLEADEEAFVGFGPAGDAEGVDGEEADEHEVTHAGEADEHEFDEVGLVPDEGGEGTKTGGVGVARIRGWRRGGCWLAHGELGEPGEGEEAEGDEVEPAVAFLAGEVGEDRVDGAAGAHADAGLHDVTGGPTGGTEALGDHAGDHFHPGDDADAADDA